VRHESIGETGWFRRGRPSSGQRQLLRLWQTSWFIAERKIIGRDSVETGVRYERPDLNKI
jgi:hypothetical protein